MIKYIEGDLFGSRAVALVNPVNIVGVMGAGIANRFKFLFPEMFEEYKRLCDNGLFHIGKVSIHRVYVKAAKYTELNQVFTMPRYIINLPTKKHWNDKSNIEDVKMGLIDTVRVIREYKINSIAMPKIGCGLGGLLWEEVNPVVRKVFSGYRGNLFVYV